MQQRRWGGGYMMGQQATADGDRAHGWMEQGHLPYLVAFAVVGYASVVGAAVYLVALTVDGLYGSRDPHVVVDWVSTLAVIGLGLLFSAPISEAVRTLRRPS